MAFGGVTASYCLAAFGTCCFGCVLWAGTLPHTFWCPCIFICNDHGQALGRWLEVAAANKEEVVATVLHIDAHNDANVPEDPFVFCSDWRRNRTCMQAIAQAADLANYQLHAVWLGLVDEIFWIRPGQGVPQYFLSTLSLDAKTGNFYEAIPTVVDTLANLSAKPSAGVLGKNFYFHEVFPNELETGAASSTMLAHLRSRPYILDIDLDFFVSSRAQPGLPPWKRDGLASCDCKRWTDQDCSLWRELEPLFRSEIWSHKCTEILNTWLRLTSEEKAFIQGLQSFNVAERLLVADQLLTPRQLVHSVELKTQLSRLEAFFLQLRDHPPAAITIARSADAFTRMFDIPALERETLAMLQRVWGEHNAVSTGTGNRKSARNHRLCVEYAEGTAPLDSFDFSGIFSINAK
mmetsp:Transcript_123322/g.226251  ORF Transcript_123322/g.226251 Transcript_123322/m.226251 type:complete len:406 (-) Transcript_123322:184-1401(-)